MLLTRSYTVDVMTCGHCSKSVIEQRPLPSDDPKQRKPDITRAQELIGFEPKVALREGLGKTIADFRSRLSEQARV